MALSRDSAREFGRLVPASVWINSFLIVFALLLLSRYMIVRQLPAFQHIYWLVAGVIFGALSVLILAQYRVRFWGYRILDPLPRNLTTLAWISLSLLAALLISLFDAIVDWHRMQHVLENHGSFFDWFIGSLTIVGIWLTYNTIIESQRIIRSFTQLYDRIEKLVDDTNQTAYQGELHFLAYTASIGYLALEEKRWDKLSGLLRSLGKRLKMICLDDEDLRNWHNHYIGRSTWRQPAEGARSLTLEDTREATKQSIATAASADSRKLKNELMPGFYLIFNSRRAIIVAPFFIPPHPLTLLSMERPKTQNVQMFGFETTDPRIIEDVSRLFAYYWESSENKEAQFDFQSGSSVELSTKLGEWFERWTPNPVLKGRFFRYRLFVAEEKPWEKAVSYLSTKLDVSDEQLRILLGAKIDADSGKIIVSVDSEDQKDWIDRNCRRHVDDAIAALDMRMKMEVTVNPRKTAATVG